MMEVLEALRNRRTVTRFKPTPIPEGKLTAILNAAHLAPSSANGQPWKMIVVRDEGLKGRLMAASHNQKAIAEAPVVVVGCANVNEAYAVLGMYMSSYPVDLGMAFSALIVAATAEGLATCWMPAFHEEKVKEILGIPSDIRVVGLIPVGYANETPPPDDTKHLSEVVSYDRFE